MSVYAVVIVPLAEKDGGGFMGLVPDLNGCISDGETPQEALTNTLSAIEEWIDEANRRGMEVPSPGDAAKKVKAKDRSMAKALKSLAESYEDIDHRIERLEGDLKDLSEQAENLGAWVRVSSITGIPIVNDDEPKILPC